MIQVQGCYVMARTLCLCMYVCTAERPCELAPLTH